MKLWTKVVTFKLLYYKVETRLQGHLIQSSPHSYLETCTFVPISARFGKFLEFGQKSQNDQKPGILCFQNIKFKKKIFF